MLFIITEDKNSAHDFWIKAATEYIGIGNFKIANNGNYGNTALKSNVNHAIKLMKPGDVLFVVFDNIANTNNFNPYDFLVNTSNICKEHNIIFHYTKYYCFEELFLSYSELIKLSNGKYDTELEYIRNAIMSGNGYTIKDSVVDNYISKANDSITNREHFANSLLINVMTGTNGFFKITKKQNTFKTNASCFIYSCDDIQSNINKHQKERMCSICKYTCKDCTSFNKIGHISKNSEIINW